jgi:predicted deacylase
MELTKSTLGDATAGSHVLITAGVHGDEYEPMEAVRRLIQGLLHRKLRGQVTLVPVVNESAFRLGSRVAEDGLDLARTCPGRLDGSVTERVAHALSALIRSADFYIDMHTGGTRLQVSPLAGYTLHPQPDVLERQRRMARVFGLPIVWGTDPGLNGRSLSVARDANVPAIYTEYLGGGVFLESGVTACLRGCLNVLADLGVIDEPVTPPQAPPLCVEDSRPNSGFLQLQHPAPRDGFFRPEVRLGDRIQHGELLGTIRDPLGSDIREIPATSSGLVLVLRTCPAVQRGDTLGVIL